MSNEKIVSNTADSLKTAAHNALVGTETLVVKAAAGGTNSFVKSLGNYGEALGAGALISAGLTQWDYVHERDNIRKQYDTELSAQTGKPYNEVTNKDLDKVGEKNIVIGDALKRARWKRNAGLVVGTVAMGAALAVGAAALTFLIAPALATLAGGTAIASGLSGIGSAIAGGHLASAALGLTQAVAVGSASIVGFMGTEAVLEPLVESKLKLKEPSLRKVAKSPQLQEQLSISSQVKFLEHLQKRVQTNKPETFISQEQVLTTLLAAQPQIAQKIKDTYGDKFSALSADQKKLAIQDVNDSGINISQITADLNHRQIRAQEMAFIVQGETSGVPRHEAPRVTALEKAHLKINQKLAQAQDEIAHLKQQMHAKSTQMGGVMQNGVAVPVDSMNMGNKAPVTASQSPVGPATERLQAQRKQAAAQGAAIGA